LLQTRRQMLALAAASSPMLLCGCADTAPGDSKPASASESGSYIIAATCVGKATPRCIESGRAAPFGREGQRLNPPCVEVCPVDAIHPTVEEPAFATTLMLYINPAECIACSACLPECPESAIYPDAGSLPSSQRQYREINADYYSAPVAR
jgi:NAD-dependent dihydropyrimidine dehydrogenase PreA subunit